MIRIRYSADLQPGLNGHAERHGHTTVVYLLPGLTPAERAATLRRMRQHGRMGVGPHLSAGGLLIALVADRFRAAFGQAGAIVRTHPAGSTFPVMVISGAVAGFLILSAMSVRIIHQPEATGGVAAGAMPLRGGQPSPADGAQPDQPGRPGQSDQPGAAPGTPGTPATPATPVTGAPRGQSPGATTGGGPGAPTPTTTGGGRALSSTAAAPPSPPNPPSPPSPPGPPMPGSATVPGRAASPARTSGSNTEVCVGVSSFGFCLTL